ncbi:MAG: glycosyltransferase family 4 protein [Anaerolineae bacterium]|nr:glycosyltransferase family 4 protein [Anaerolineae bacterium]
MRRVLFVDKAPQMGGSLVSLYHLVRGLDRTRFEPIVLVAEGNPSSARFSALGVRVLTRPWANTPPQASPLLQGLTRTSAVRKLRDWEWGRRLYHSVGFLVKYLPRILERAEAFANLLYDVRPDWVHVNDGIPFNRGEILGALWARVPVVCHVRSFEPPTHFDRLLAPRIAAYIFISHAIADWILGTGVRLRKWYVVHNGVDLGEFQIPADARPRLRAELGLPNDAFVVALLGRVVPWKGHEVFLDAMERLIPSHPNLRGCIVGEGWRGHDFEQRLRARVESGPLKGRVVFAGFRPDVPALLQAVDALAHTSVEPEPFGRVIVEAMAVRLPIVATAAGAVPEILEDERTSLLVPPGDADRLAQALERLMRDPDLRRRLSDAARQEVEARFTVQQYVAGVQAVYEELR